MEKVIVKVLEVFILSYKLSVCAVQSMVLLFNLPVVAKVLLLDVTYGKCMSIGSCVHNSPIGCLNRK